jgi:hypothetical protein
VYRRLTPKQRRLIARQISDTLGDVSLDDAYSLLAGLMHSLLCEMPDGQVDMLLIFFVTHAWESRAARAEARIPNFATKYQLTQFAKLESVKNERIDASVAPRITLTQQDWDHLPQDRRQDGAQCEA